MTVQELQEKVRLAEERVAKIEKTIERHKAQREKKILEVNKILEQNGISERYDDFKDEKNVTHRFYETPFYDEIRSVLYDVTDKDSDIKNSERKLVESKEILKNWKEKLGREEAKLQFIQDSVPEVIKQFLEDWKVRTIKYYTKKAEAYPEAYKQYRLDLHRAYYDALKATVDRLVEEDKAKFIEDYCWGKEARFQEVMEMLAQYSPDGPKAYCNSYYSSYSEIFHFGYRDKNNPYDSRRYESVEESFKMRFGDGFFQSWKDRKFDSDWLNEEIEEEKNNKLVDLMNRVMKITGTITDAKGLYMENADINGIIIGKRGKAKVQTIGAGGYNDHIVLSSGRRGQRFHFRVLIDEIK